MSYKARFIYEKFLYIIITHILVCLIIEFIIFYSYPQLKWGIVFVLWDEVVYNINKWDIVGQIIFCNNNYILLNYYAYWRIHSYTR